MKILAAALSSWLLVACGGGGASSVTVTASVATGDFTVSGTAATGNGISMTANMTPLTEMLVARVLRDDPFRFFSDGSLGDVTGTALKAAACRHHRA